MSKPCPEGARQAAQVRDDAMSEGVLRLAVTRDWVSGESSLPVSNMLSAKDTQKESDKRKELNLLRYEALKDELELPAVNTVSQELELPAVYTVSYSPGLFYGGSLFTYGTL